MEPTDDGFSSRWRTFHPLDTVRVQNPFDETFTWRVADENNRQNEYSIKPHDTATLPGGLIATLGVKGMVDKLIMDDNKPHSMWDKKVRTEYEERVILSVKQTGKVSEPQEPQEVRSVDLSDGNTKAEKVKKTEEKEPEFPELTKATKNLPKEAEIEV